MSLEELFAGSTINIPEMLLHLKRRAQSLNLPFGERTKTYNSRLAQELGLWAESQGVGDDFHMLAFLAYFDQGKNLAEENVLLQITRQLGFVDEEPLKVLRERTFKEKVDQDWQLSRDLGVRSVPTFMYGPATLVGAQPYEELEKLIKTHI